MYFFVDAKRLIGRRFEDATVQADMKHWPFEVVSDGGKPKIRINYKGENKIFSPEEVNLKSYCCIVLYLDCWTK